MTTSEQASPGDSSQSKSRAGAASVCGAFMNAFDELGRAMKPPESAERHFREAHKQVLMGLRELLDYRIERLSRDDIKGTRVVAE